MVRDVEGNEKNGKGWDFGNPGNCLALLEKVARRFGGQEWPRLRSLRADPTRLPRSQAGVNEALPLL